MKFSCDRCRAQYMISDEKVRPNGVKVRCKKCGHVIVVKRASAEVPVVAPASAARVPFETQVGADGLRRSGSLDEEIGAAFDTMVSDSPAPATEPAPAQPAEEDPGRWLDELGGTPDVASEPEPARAAAPPAPDDSPVPDSDWFLAVDGEQVGPLRLDTMRERWDRAEIGPDTLCWRNGMVEWTPLSQIAELAGVLAPLPRRPAARPDPDSANRPAAERAPAEPEPWARPTPEAAPADPGFRPTAASALASLVEKEVVAARNTESQAAKEAEEPAAPAIETTGIRMLLRSLPEAPPGEPSRFIPLQRSAEPAPAKAAAPAPVAVAPAKRSKGPMVAVLAVIVTVPLAAAGAWFAFGARPEKAPASESVLARAERPATEPPKPVEPAKPPPAAEAPVAAVDEGAGKAKAAEPGDEKGDAKDIEKDAGEKIAVADAAKAAAPVPDEKPLAKEEPAQHAAKAEPSRKAEPPRKAEAPARVARQEPTRAPEPAPPAPQPKRSSGGLLDAAGSSSIDDLFEKEFSGGKQPPASKPSATYIPPPPGAGNQLPAQLGQGDITGVVVGHKSAIKGCVTDYKNVGGAESGTLVMRWTIEPGGTTSGVQPVKGAEHQKLATCVGGLIKGWKFPAYSGPRMAPIDFPFQF